MDRLAAMDDAIERRHGETEPAGVDEPGAWRQNKAISGAAMCAAGVHQSCAAPVIPAGAKRRAGIHSSALFRMKGGSRTAASPLPG
jgi:hypothetical protein